MFHNIYITWYKSLGKNTINRQLYDTNNSGNTHLKADIWSMHKQSYQLQLTAIFYLQSKLKIKIFAMSLTWQMSAFRFNFCCNQVENECSFFKSTKRNVINVKKFFREILEKHDGLVDWSCVCAQHSLRFPASHTVKLFVHYKNIKHPQCRCSTSNTTNCNASCIREDLCQHSKIFQKNKISHLSAQLQATSSILEGFNWALTTVDH